MATIWPWPCCSKKGGGLVEDHHGAEGIDFEGFAQTLGVRVDLGLIGEQTGSHDDGIQTAEPLGRACDQTSEGARVGDVQRLDLNLSRPAHSQIGGDALQSGRYRVRLGSRRRHLDASRLASCSAMAEVAPIIKIRILSPRFKFISAQQI
jgi:hypothetical protein